VKRAGPFARWPRRSEMKRREAKRLESGCQPMGMTDICGEYRSILLICISDAERTGSDSTGLARPQPDRCRVTPPCPACSGVLSCHRLTLKSGLRVGRRFAAMATQKRSIRTN